MKTLAANAESSRFQSEADKYASYLETPEGRLRLDLPFANLQEFLPLTQPKPDTRALDLGCGTGANGLRLARMGFRVTLLDSSPAMLDIAKRAAQEAGIIEKIETKQGDADRVPTLFDGETFDVILVHNVLEFVDDPGAVLSGAARALRDSSAILSVLVRNQAGEVFKAAILAGDLAAAEHTLTSEWGNEALYGGRVRLFTPRVLNWLDSVSMGATDAPSTFTVSCRRSPKLNPCHSAATTGVSVWHFTRKN